MECSIDKGNYIFKLSELNVKSFNKTRLKMQLFLTTHAY